VSQKLRIDSRKWYAGKLAPDSFWDKKQAKTEESKTVPDLLEILKLVAAMGREKVVEAEVIESPVTGVVEPGLLPGEPASHTPRPRPERLATSLQGVFSGDQGQQWH
jgi:hypothetical protein